MTITTLLSGIEGAYFETRTRVSAQEALCRCCWVLAGLATRRLLCAHALEDLAAVSRSARVAFAAVGETLRQLQKDPRGGNVRRML